MVIYTFKDLIFCCKHRRYTKVNKSIRISDQKEIFITGKISKNKKNDEKSDEDEKSEDNPPEQEAKSSWSMKHGLIALIFTILWDIFYFIKDFLVSIILKICG